LAGRALLIHIDLLDHLIAWHNILTEETEGMKSCIATMHNLSKDIKHFGPPDNFWCYSFERAVEGYTQRSSNAKHLEYTFARSECRREFLKFLDCNSDSITAAPNDHEAVHSVRNDLIIVCSGIV